MLTDLKVKGAKPAAKGYKLTDSNGLHLFVSPAGGKSWRYRYEFGGKEKLLTIGQYPEIGLGAARDLRNKARTVLDTGRDPALVKIEAQKQAADEAANTFEVLAREWHKIQAPTWSEVHAGDVLTSLEWVFPDIGHMPIKEITAPDVLATLRKIEKRPAIETAKRTRQRISAVFVYAIASGLADNDPAAIVADALAPLIKGKQPAVTDLEEAREMLQAVEAIPAHPVTKLAMRLLALTVTRPGTLGTTPWAELADLDPEKPVWIIPPERMKLKRQHKEDEAREFWIPLSRQAAETIEALRKLTGKGVYVFPNARHSYKPMSENALGYMLNRAGYFSRHCPHGWRSTFSTVMNEKFPLEWKIIDSMLAHVPKDEVEAAYNRAAYLDRRRELAQIYADLLLDGFPHPEALLDSRMRINRPAGAAPRPAAEKPARPRPRQPRQRREATRAAILRAI